MKKLIKKIGKIVVDLYLEIVDIAEDTMKRINRRGQ